LLYESPSLHPKNLWLAFCLRFELEKDFFGRKKTASKSDYVKQGDQAPINRAKSKGQKGELTCALTGPERAIVVYWPVYTPFSSRCPTLIWMDAWSFEVISLFVAELQNKRIVASAWFYLYQLGLACDL
jgi:hypothetical protein